VLKLEEYKETVLAVWMAVTRKEKGEAVVRKRQGSWGPLLPP
jgi:hypothetical protein